MDIDFDPNEIEDELEYNSDNEDVYSDVENYEDPYEEEPLFNSKDIEIEKKEIKFEKDKGREIENANDYAEEDDDDDAVSEIDEEDFIQESIKEEDLKEQINDSELSDVKKYKKENVENFSKIGVTSLLANIVHYIKTGGSMLDGREIFDYPNETEESYAIESIILKTHPFEYVIGPNTLINLKHESLLICLKLKLRAVSIDNTIFFTPSFTKTFPIFYNNIFNDNISIEEWEEIEKVKKERNII